MDPSAYSHPQPQESFPDREGVKTPLFPEYDSAMDGFFETVIGNLSKIEEPLLALIPRVNVGHSAKPSKLGRGRMAEMTILSAHSEFRNQDLLECNIEAWATFAHSVSVQFARKQSEMIFRFIREVTEETGNVIDARGETFSHDLFLDLLEKLDFEVDDQMKPIGLNMVVDTKTFEKLSAMPPATPEQVQRQEQIMQEKFRRQNAKKRVRKLD